MFFVLDASRIHSAAAAKSTVNSAVKRKSVCLSWWAAGNGGSAVNVDQLQKINALASELRKYNFADSSQDAAKQAEQLYWGQANKANEMQHSEITQKPAEQMQEMPKQPQVNDELMRKQMEILLDLQNKKNYQEFALLRSAINQLSSELEAMRTQMQKLVVQERPKEEQKELPRPVKEAPAEKKQDHPRQGSFSSSDVDIQKMFYFGNQ